MSVGFSLKEAAAIAGLPEAAVRTAVKKIGLPRSDEAGAVRRCRFGVKEVFFLRLLAEFPFNLRDDDKLALRDLVLHGKTAVGRWRAEKINFLLKGDDLDLSIDTRRMRDRLARNLLDYRRGRRRIVSDSEILGGEPVFSGTRIPLAHIATLIAKGVNPQEIIADYPALTAAHLAYAEFHARMKPNLDRPCKPLELRRSRKAGLAAAYAAADR